MYLPTTTSSDVIDKFEQNIHFCIRVEHLKIKIVKI